MKTSVTSVVKSIIAGTVASLPRGGRDAVTDRLVVKGMPFRVFSKLATQFNVLSVSVNGEYGIIQSAASDVTILSVYALTGRWASLANDLFQDFFERHDGGTYIDVGANIGLTTIPVARNPNVRCFAIEPEPTNYTNLVRNIEVNCRNNNVTAFQTAVYSRVDLLQFEIASASGNLGDHRIRNNDAPGAFQEHMRPTISVQAAPLDTIVPHVWGPLAVKIDTEGAEPFVVVGGKKTLEKCQLLVLEFWPYAMARLGADCESMIRYLEENYTSVAFSKEEESLSEKLPVAQGAAALRVMARDHRDNPYEYFDVVATR